MLAADSSGDSDRCPTPEYAYSEEKYNSDDSEERYISDDSEEKYKSDDSGENGLIANYDDLPNPIEVIGDRSDQPRIMFNVDPDVVYCLVMMW
eukprot:238967_1